MPHIPQRKTTILKYEKIQERYKYLHDTKRLRRDDCIAKIMDDFFIEHEETVYRILGTDISAQLAMLALEKNNKPKQLTIAFS